MTVWVYVLAEGDCIEVRVFRDEAKCRSCVDELGGYAIKTEIIEGVLP